MSDIESLKARFRKAAQGNGVAIRREEDPPIPGEPLMSMDRAAEIYAELAASDQSKLAEAERALRMAVAGMTCRGDDAHYCPNCDRTTFEARENARIALATIREEEPLPKQGE